MDRVPEIGMPGTQNQPKIGFQKSFSSTYFFLPNLWYIWLFFKVSQQLSECSTLKNHQFGKKWQKKPCSTCLQTISQQVQTSKNPKPRFRVSDQSLMSSFLQWEYNYQTQTLCCLQNGESPTVHSHEPFQRLESILM